MARDELLDIFNDFTRDENCSILLSSHIVSDLEKICDYIAFLHKGRLVLCEEKDRLLEEYALIRLTEERLRAAGGEHHKPPGERLRHGGAGAARRNTRGDTDRAHEP